MNPVVWAVNLIRAWGLKCQQFKSFLEYTEADLTDELYHLLVKRGKSTTDSIW